MHGAKETIASLIEALDWRDLAAMDLEWILGCVGKVVSDAFRYLDCLPFGGRLHASLAKPQAAQAVLYSPTKGNIR